MSENIDISNAKVLLVNYTLSPYRVATLNELAGMCKSLTSAFVVDKTVDPCRFEKHQIKMSKVGPAYMFRGLRKLIKKADVVVFETNLRYVSLYMEQYLHPRKKFVGWNIGFRASYTLAYDVNRPHTFSDRLYGFLLNRLDANVMYMDKAREFWRGTRFNLDKCFTAPNTVAVSPVESDEPRNSILFVGTLYPQKGVDKLIDAFAEATASNGNSHITLDIVGDGTMRESLEQQVKERHLEDRVKFHGAIFNEEKLAPFFARALACVSPTQAGLTVPKSMGYGVPMITRADAITGGEIFHITPGVNGITYHTDDELPQILSRLLGNPAEFEQMGRNAREYYLSSATPRHQALGVAKAIEYALSR